MRPPAGRAALDESRSALTATELARIAALRKATRAETGLFERHYPIGDALHADHALSPVQSLLTLADIFTAWHTPGGLEAWLLRQSPAARQAAERLTLGHLLPGNHPGGVCSALLPGWLLGCKQIARPSTRLARFTQALVDQVQAALTAELHAAPPPCTIQTWDAQAADSPARLAALLGACDVLTAQGSDLTVAAIETAWAALPADRRPHLIGFPARLSLIAIDCTRDFSHNACEDIAAQLVAGDQKGCLSPHGIFLIGPPARRAAFLDPLCAALQSLDVDDGTLSAEEQLAAAYQHRVYAELSAAPRSDFAVRELPADSTCDAAYAARLWLTPPAEPPLALTGRCYWVWQTTTAAQAARAIADWHTPLQAVGCFPDALPFARAFASLQAWITDGRNLSAPPVDWPQDGCDLMTRLTAIAAC